MNNILTIRGGPHLKAPVDTVTIMRNVVWALVPTVLFAIYHFGLAALLLLSTTTFVCVATEWFLGRGTQPSTIRDWSAVITGLLLGLTLPPGLPLWMAALGALAAMLLGKLLFGGLGANPLNPALVGRVFLMAAFPAPMTSWYAISGPERFSQVVPGLLALPMVHPVYDGVSGATPLGAWKFAGEPTAIEHLLLGFTGGSLGETSVLLILCGGLYLAVRHMLDWRIPVSILATVFVLGLFGHQTGGDKFAPPLFHLFSGGLMLGAFFMATDMVTSPVNPLAVWIYGVLIGIVIMVIRFWGGLPEGVMYAILLGNAVTPLIERSLRPAPFGGAREVAP